MNVKLEVSQHLEEKLVDEAEEHRLECDSEGDDLYHMNISVDLANRDVTEADVTEVDQEVIDALVEIKGQKEFPCTKCDKICKLKGGLTRHSNSKHRGKSVDSGSRVNTGLCQARMASIVETIKNNIIQENIYGNEINTSLKTVSAGEALSKAIMPLHKTSILPRKIKTSCSRISMA